MDLLLSHGYLLHRDPLELKIMKPYPPLGLLYLSAYLKQADFSVSVFDSTFAEPAAFVARLAEGRPSLVGLYSTLMTKFRVLEMIREAKAIGARVVVGGPDPPAYAEEYLGSGADVVVIGEGEETLRELLIELARRSPESLHAVRGIAFRDESGKVIRTPPRPFVTPLDRLPFPDRDAIDMDAYLRVWRDHHGTGSVSLICARGCPYHCDWCSHAVYGESHRRHSPERMASEVELIRDCYRPDQLWYADDVFTIHPSWTIAYAKELERRGLRLPFECISRADRMSEEIVQTLAKMGCFRVWIGSESGSQKLLDGMRRGVSVEQVQAATRLCQRHGIQVGMFIMLGYEGEEREDLTATVEHLKRARPDVFLTTVAYPIKGTGYYDKVQDRVRAHAPWAQRSDRDLAVAGRHSRRYYEAAMRWMTSEVGFHRELRATSGSWRRYARLARNGINWLRGRIGMALAAREIEC